MPELPVLVCASVAVFLGALVQGSLGVGLALVSAPVVQIAAPRLMPGSLLLVAAVLAVLGAVREISHTDWHGVSWALTGRVAGTAAASYVVLVVSGPTLDLLSAGITLGVVSLLAFDPERLLRNRGTLLASGAVAGLTGTTSSIGGPFIALVYHREPGPTIRGTLNVFYTAGTLLSLASLAVVGRLPGEQLAFGALLLPAVVAGFALSGPVRRHVDGSGRTRGAVLVLAVAAALVLIVRGLVAMGGA
ncbi:TSUP family transporter [Streptomyces huasconensis]|uniref:Probable membrane transporter protein n=1 Tax=Streptomyces huasconensis TaxID=1854574 RepID=A0ABV3M2X0_9ACTN